MRVLHFKSVIRELLKILGEFRFHEEVLERHSGAFRQKNSPEYPYYVIRCIMMLAEEADLQVRSVWESRLLQLFPAPSC